MFFRCDRWLGLTGGASVVMLLILHGNVISVEHAHLCCVLVLFQDT